MPRRFFAVNRLLPALFLLAAAPALRCVEPAPVTSTESAPHRDPEGRVARARERCQPALAARFATLGMTYPPRAVFLHAFKREAVIEAWVRGEGDTFTLVRTYPVTAASGRPGPKRREGDRQVPEGFYTIDAFNPLSVFHLSLRVDYPNAADRLLSDREKPGFDIYIHGGRRSVGCLALGDPAIEELYLLALDAGNRNAIPVHIFPARMAGPRWEKFVAPFRERDPALVRFWEQLQPGFAEFERTRRVPVIRVEPDGGYSVARDR